MMTVVLHPKGLLEYFYLLLFCRPLLLSVCYSFVGYEQLSRDKLPEDIAVWIGLLSPLLFSALFLRCSIQSASSHLFSPFIIPCIPVRNTSNVQKVNAFLTFPFQLRLFIYTHKTKKEKKRGNSGRLDQGD